MAISSVGPIAPRRGTDVRPGYTASTPDLIGLPARSAPPHIIAAHHPGPGQSTSRTRCAPRPREAIERSNVMDKSTPRLPSPAIVVAIIALFVSLGGTGYAASQLSGSPTAVAGKAKKKKKPVKILRGKTGPTGPSGPTGVTGAQGKDGVQAKEGPQGKEGPKGESGTAIAFAH